MKNWGRTSFAIFSISIGFMIWNDHACSCKISASLTYEIIKEIVCYKDAKKSF